MLDHSVPRYLAEVEGGLKIGATGTPRNGVGSNAKEMKNGRSVIVRGEKASRALHSDAILMKRLSYEFARISSAEVSPSGYFLCRHPGWIRCGDEDENEARFGAHFHAGAGKGL
jgi:hypothetical protein